MEDASSLNRSHYFAASFRSIEWLCLLAHTVRVAQVLNLILFFQRNYKGKGIADGH